MEYLSIREAARRYRVSPETVRRWIKRGAPHVRMGGPACDIRLEAENLEAWLDAYRQGKWSRV